MVSTSWPRRATAARPSSWRGSITRTSCSWTSPCRSSAGSPPPASSRRSLPAVAVVVLTASEDDADLFEAVKSGAQGFLPKDLEATRFFELLEGVTRGEPALTPGLARKVLGAFARPESGPAPQPADALTTREREVLELLVQGITSNRELAERLFVSENTIKYHLRHILDKLHLQNRAQVIAYALRHGLVERSDSDPSSSL